MKKVILSIVFVFSQNIYGQSAWEKVGMDLDKPLKNIFFLNENIGWGFSSVYNSSTWKHDKEIHRTTNGGVNWTSALLTEDVGFLKFRFVTQDTGWGIGGCNIFKTCDSGITWDVKFTGNKSFYKIFCINSKICWVLCYEKILLRTTDGGESWDEYAINVSGRDVVDIYFINENIGFCCYEGIFKTTDGGITWIRKQNDLSYGDFHCIQFVNDSVEWAAGHAIYKTNDCGETWFFQKKLGTVNSGAVADYCYFINENKGWINSEFITLDGGDSWIEYNPGVEYLTNLCFVNDNIGYAIDRINGHLYKTTTGGILTSINDNRQKNIPFNFKLYQNYPNPFNPKTTIKYNLHKSSKVVLKIFNLAGQEIVTLVDGFQKTGQYEIKWQPEGLPSGIYLARLQAGGYSEIRKLVLQK